MGNSHLVFIILKLFVLFKHILLFKDCIYDHLKIFYKLGIIIKICNNLLKYLFIDCSFYILNYSTRLYLIYIEFI